MLSFWTQLRKYPSIRQLMLLSGVLLTTVSQGQSSPTANYVERIPNRIPASYMPDDDVIVKPSDNQLSFYQQYIASDESDEVAQSRNQLKVWNDNQQFADNYGHDSTLAGSMFVPTSEEKWDYFKDKYMRYLRRKGEQPLKDMPKTWYQEYRASNEVDTIDEMEARFKKTNKQSNGDKSIIPSSLQEREVSLWKETKFIFQPRVDQGLVVVGIRGPIAYARAWVGVNGKTEVNVQKNIDSVGFRAMYNYETDTGKNFVSLDQRIVENVYARATSLKDPKHAIEDDSLMLLYAKQF
ncbi:MAG TPA: hypothetical protein VNJ08_06855 [Bacteriovoracaceae bacterium]|nr:hypothetical protein [Bacteriovoracaceae bacterium]